MPLLVLLLFYAAFGVLTAFIGISVGRKVLKTDSVNEFKEAVSSEEDQRKVKAEFPHSLFWLVTSFAVIVFSLIMIGNSSWYIWVSWSLLWIIVWSIRYKRGLKQLSKPKFWISFAFITILAAVLVSLVNGSGNSWIDGLWMGLEMNTRAAIVIVGFSVLGTELYNSKIRTYLANSAYRQAGTALELAFETLPYVIGQLPDARTFLTQPGKDIHLLIQHAEYRLNEIDEKNRANVILISGGVADGKTTIVKELVKELKAADRSISGFISPRIMAKGKTIGYDIEIINTSERLEFLRENTIDLKGSTIGKYLINEAALLKARQVLNIAMGQAFEFVVIDEVGRLEIGGGGWYKELKNLLETDATLIVSIRDEFTDEVIKCFDIKNATIFPAKVNNVTLVMQFLNLQDDLPGEKVSFGK